MVGFSRTRGLEDVAKRAAYRKAHGLDKDEGFGGWTAKTDEQALGPAIMIEGTASLAEGDARSEPGVEPQRQKRPPVKKWFGIW